MSNVETTDHDKVYEIIDKAFELADKEKYNLAIIKLRELNVYGAEVADVDAVMIAGKVGDVLKKFIVELVKAISYIITLAKTTADNLKRFVQISLLDNSDIDSYKKSLSNMKGKIHLNALDKEKYNSKFQATLELAGNFDGINLDVDKTLTAVETAIKNITVDEGDISIKIPSIPSTTNSAIDSNRLKNKIIKEKKLIVNDYNIINNGTVVPINMYGDKVYFIGYMKKFPKTTLGLTFSNMSVKASKDISNVNISELTKVIERLLDIDKSYLKAVDNRIALIEKEFLKAKRKVNALEAYDARSVLSAIKGLCICSETELKILMGNIKALRGLAKAVVGE